MPSSASPDIASTWRADAALASLALMWGTTFVITKDVVTTHSPLFYTSMRFGLAAIGFGLLFAGHLRRSRRKEVREGIILGLCVFAGISLQVSGIVYTTASKAGFITGLYLVFTPLISYLVFRVRPNRDNLAGLVLAIGGFALLSLPKSGAGINDGSLWGDLLVLGAASAWATHIVATSVYGRRSDIRTLAAVQVFTVAALALIAYLVLHSIAVSAADPQTLPRLLSMEARANPLTGKFMVQVGYMALFATVLAALVQTWAQGKLSPTHSAILYALEPVSGAFFAFLVFDERLGKRGGFGAALIIAGVLVSRLGLWSRFFHRRATGIADYPGKEVTEQ